MDPKPDELGNERIFLYAITGKKNVKVKQKLSAALVRLCRSRGIATTKKVNGRRIQKSITEIKKQLRKK